MPTGKLCLPNEVRTMLSDIFSTELKQTRFYQDVFREGELVGEKRGEKRGEYLLLKKQIIRRFGTLPDWADERLANASSTQLESWAERIFDANSLEDLFVN
jgi:predicted transposase YdaD